jgi:hypothetical protein
MSKRKPARARKARAASKVGSKAARSRIAGYGMSDNVQAAIVPNMSVTPDGNRE